MPAAAIATSAVASRLGGLVDARGLRVHADRRRAHGARVLPGSAWWWTIAPQMLVGVGLGLTLSALTERALHGRSPQAVHGGWTIAARHAGVVVGPPAAHAGLHRRRSTGTRTAPPRGRRGRPRQLDPAARQAWRRTGRPRDRPRRRPRGARRARGVRRPPRRRRVPDARGAARLRARSRGDRRLLAALPPRGAARARRARADLPSRGGSRACEAGDGRSSPASRWRSRSPAPTSRSADLVRADAGRRPVRPAPPRGTSGTGERIELVLLAAADETACELGVSREDLVLALRSVDELEELAEREGARGTSSRTPSARARARAVDEARRGRPDRRHDAGALTFAAERLPSGCSSRCSAAPRRSSSSRPRGCPPPGTRLTCRVRNGSVATCLECGAAVPPAAQFCPSCGRVVGAPERSIERKLATVLFADLVGSTAAGGLRGPRTDARCPRPLLRGDGGRDRGDRRDRGEVRRRRRHGRVRCARRPGGPRRAGAPGGLLDARPARGAVRGALAPQDRSQHGGARGRTAAGWKLRSRAAMRSTSRRGSSRPRLRARSSSPSAAAAAIVRARSSSTRPRTVAAKGKPRASSAGVSSGDLAPSRPRGARSLPADVRGPRR